MPNPNDGDEAEVESNADEEEITHKLSNNSTNK
jgi:hypothetical protein